MTSDTGVSLGSIFAVGVALLVTVFGLLSCRGCSSSQKPCDVPSGTIDQEAGQIDQYHYCWTRPIKPHTGTINILVDASGSMTGFHKEMRNIVDWIANGLSELRESTIGVTESRICQFSVRRDALSIRSCVPMEGGLRNFDARGDTNLDEAIRSSVRNELTVIVTDGVGATGVGGSKDCTGGVDSACVARALLAAVQAPLDDEFEELDRGAWIIPMAAPYEGKFFTEELVPPDRFDEDATAERVREETGSEAVVTNPREGRHGRLEFGYKGPRALIILIIARHSEVGRAAVQAIWNNRKNAVFRANGLNEYVRGLLGLQPIEVYPGRLNSIVLDTRSWERTGRLADKCGTMAAWIHESSTTTPRLVLDCREGETAWERFQVRLSRPGEDDRSRCVKLNVLPWFSFTASPVNSSDDSMMSAALRDLSMTGSDEAKFLLACDGTPLRHCAQGSIGVQWTAQPEYKATANALARGGGLGDVAATVVSISTNRPGLEPHRIFGLADTLEDFYRELRKGARQPLTAFEFCAK